MQRKKIKWCYHLGFWGGGGRGGLGSRLLRKKQDQHAAPLRNGDGDDDDDEDEDDADDDKEET